MVGRDVAKMLAVGLVWGATNAFMRRSAIIWDQALKSTPQTNTPLLKKWLKLLMIWQYTLPFLINLSASVTFFAILSDSPISLAVPSPMQLLLLPLLCLGSFLVKKPVSDSRCLLVKSDCVLAGCNYRKRR